MNVSACIIYEDNHLIAVNKPANLLCQGDKTGDVTLLDHVGSWIKSTYNKPGRVFLGLPHRLDRPVSGVVVLCKTSKALSRMNNLFNQRKIEKRYIAKSANIPEKFQGKIDSFLLKNTKTNKSQIVTPQTPGAKQAITKFEYILEQQLFILHPETGRSHQLRVHMTSLGCPILGDLKYGATEPLSDQSIALHCHALGFVHPVKKEKIEITAMLPERPWWQL